MKERKIPRCTGLLGGAPVALSMLTLALSLGLSATCDAQQVSLSIRDGRVTLKTENATIRQILDEWARVGQAKVVNAEKVSGPPQTLMLIDVPEREALDTVLRQAAGYAVVERDAAAASNASVFDKILVMGRTTPVSQNASAAPVMQTYTPPDVSDEAVAENEPPQPTAPVVNPYANGGGPAGAAGANANNAYPGVGGPAGAAGNTVNVRPPETKFDYTNPQAYFEAQRRNQQAAQQQQQQTAQPGVAPPPQQQLFNPYPGSNAPPIAITGGGATFQSQPNLPTGQPTAGNTSSQPGIAPVPQTAPPQGQGGGFNPYNMNPYQMPPNAGSTPPTTPVEPDRAKYANPYAPTKPPNQ